MGKGGRRMGLKTPPGGMNKTAGPEVLAIGDVLMDYQYWVDRFPQRGGDSLSL